MNNMTPAVKEQLRERDGEKAMKAGKTFGVFEGLECPIKGEERCDICKEVTSFYPAYCQAIKDVIDKNIKS